MTNPHVALVRLSDTSRTVADPFEDVRGRKVRDNDRNEIGKVDDLLIDPEQNKVRFLRVEHGGILGFGATPSFIPIEAVGSVGETEVVLAQSRERIAGAPRFDPDLVEHSAFYGDTYGYYGYPPFWGLSTPRQIPGHR